MPHYAGFWLRVVAYVMDWVIVEVATGVVVLVVASTVDPWTLTDWAAPIGLVVAWLYWAGLESSPRQATLGKMAVGIQVTDLAGQRLGFGRALARNLAKVLSSLILGLGYLMAGWTARKQALHDLIAGTLVIKAPDLRAPPAPPPLLSGRAPERPSPRQPE